MTITEQITWALLKDKWPEPSDATLSLIVGEYGEDGPEFWVVDGCICYEDDDDTDPHYPRRHVWFEDSRGNSIESSFAPGPTARPVKPSSTC